MSPADKITIALLISGQLLILTGIFTVLRRLRDDIQTIRTCTSMRFQSWLAEERGAGRIQNLNSEGDR